jgi:molecular chaperone GrpE
MSKKEVKEKPSDDLEEAVKANDESEEQRDDNSVKTDQEEKTLEECPEEQLQEKYDDLNDKYLRLYSEFDNYRRRTLRERIEFSKTASMEVISQLLPVLDDFERAIRAFNTNGESIEALKEGLILIFNKFLSILGQQGLAQMKTLGEEFNTDFHEAITNIPAPTPEQKNKIIDEVEKGYLLNGKVIRYAKVVVGS